MIYELWDVPTANLIATFDTKEEALTVVRDTIAVHSAAFAEGYLLSQEDKAGRSRLIAEGKALVALASGEIGAKKARAS